MTKDGSNNITTREAKEGDLDAIYGLINELAHFEKAPEEVTLTPVQLRTDFNKGLFNAFIAEKNKEVMGMALIYPVYSTWKGLCYYLEDIIVKEEHRRNGLGTLLFDKVVEFAKQNNAARLRWQVLDWNTPAIKFYEKYDAVFEKEWLTYKLTKEQLSNDCY
jgi:GNAT superfamily N-acetyltransferase